MNRRPLLIVAVYMLCGTLIILYDSFIFSIIPVLTIPFIFYRRRTTRAIILLSAAAVCFFLGIISGHLRSASYDRAFEAINSRRKVSVYGKVTRKEHTSYGITNYLTLRGTSNIRIAFTTETDMCSIASLVKVTGSPQKPSPQRNPGCFDQSSYYRSQSLVTSLKDAECCVIDNRPGVLEMLYHIRYRISDVLMALLPGEEGSLLASLCLGTKGLLDADVKELLGNAGLSHILAISGLHISIMGNAAFSGMKRLGLPARVSAIISFVMVFMYSHAISDSVSARRAVIMYLTFVAAEFCIEKTDTLTSLSIAMIYVCVTDPLAICGSAFVMSFAAVFLIAVLAVPAGKCYRTFCDLRWENTHKRTKGARHHNTAFEDFISSLLFSFCIQLSMACISAAYFYHFPLLSCILNTLVLPFLPSLIIMGIAGGAVGLILTLPARIMLFPCHLILYWYELSSSAYTRLPFSDIVTGHTGIVKVIICLALVIAISSVLRIQNRRLFAIRFTKLPWKKIPLFPIFGDKKTVFKAVVMSAAIVIILAFPAHKDSFMMLDVGQGDGLMLTTSDGKCFMFDGGSTTESSPGRNILLPSLRFNGISQVDGWFLTHLDDDHINGFTEIVQKGYPVRNLYLSEKIPHDDKYAMITSLCEAHDIHIRYLRGGDRLKCRFFSLDALFPDAASDFEGPNENSLVTLICLNWKDGTRTQIIETGDIGADQEKYILDKYARRIKKNPHDTLILKSAHHGSNYSNCSEWLSATAPDLILISAGMQNRYGHPGRDTIARINDAGLKYLCTIQTGQIELGPGGYYCTTIS